MSPRVIVDSGPIVAYLHRGDRHHTWAEEQFAVVAPPMVTCEAVLSEACFLLRDLHGGSEAVLALLETGTVAVPFRLQERLHAVKSLVARYANIPMSLADACLVSMAEQYPRASVMTLDNDFTIYRKDGRQIIPLLMPP